MAALDRKKAIMGLSGGVDSSAAALFLREKGYEVTGLFFDVRGDNDEGRREAQRAAEQLGIDFIYKDVSRRFHDVVIRNFCTEYSSGRTPNPCVLCNPNIKFMTLLEEADRIGAYYIATGHYAKVRFSQALDAWFVERAASDERDQSYMLYRLPQNVLSRLLLPLAESRDKADVRDKARVSGLANHDAKDSQEICFIDGDYKDYLKQAGTVCVPGDFIDIHGNIIGEHRGIINYTLGQRKGLGTSFGKRVFVIDIDAESNTVTLGSNEDLFRNHVISSHNFFTMTGSGELPASMEGTEIRAKIRYAARPAEAILRHADKAMCASLEKARTADGCGQFIVTAFKDRQRAATPGQSIVFYLDEKVIGGGIIEKG